MGRILSIAYDKSLLSTRQTILEGCGHVVQSAINLDEALDHCQETNFGLAIIGHSVPLSDKNAIITKLKESCNVPILALQQPHQDPFPGADYNFEIGKPKEFLDLVNRILDRRPLPQADF